MYERRYEMEFRCERLTAVENVRAGNTSIERSEQVLPKKSMSIDMYSVQWEIDSFLCTFDTHIMRGNWYIHKRTQQHGIVMCPTFTNSILAFGISCDDLMGNCDDVSAPNRLFTVYFLLFSEQKNWSANKCWFVMKLK